MRRRFIAAKVNINEGIFNQDVNYLINLIPKIILSYPEYSTRRSHWIWCFGELEYDEDESVICGYFVKKRNEKKQIQMYVGRKLEPVDIPNAGYQSFFLYNTKTEILIFEENGQIPRETFMRSFEQIIYNGHFEIGEISVQFIPIKDIVEKKIRDIEILTKIEFDLVHPNPISDDAYKDMDDLLKKEKATRLKTTLENQNGLKKDGTFIQSGIEMVSKGYGDVKAYGFSRIETHGRRKVRKDKKSFRSKDAIQMIHTDQEDSKDDLMSKLKSFAERVSRMLL